MFSFYYSFFNQTPKHCRIIAQNQCPLNEIQSYELRKKGRFSCSSKSRHVYSDISEHFAH